MWTHGELHACGLTGSYMHVDSWGATCMWTHGELHACGLTGSYMHVDSQGATLCSSLHAAHVIQQVRQFHHGISHD